MEQITKVIFNDPATIVFWSDGTKTVVKCSEDDEYDMETGLAMAVCKKLSPFFFAKFTSPLMKEGGTLCLLSLFAS